MLVTFENYLAAIGSDNVNRSDVLTNFLSANVYEFTTDYQQAGEVLFAVYVKTPTDVFARHKLYMREQQSEETLNDFLHYLKLLSKDCNFHNVTANEL